MSQRLNILCIKIRTRGVRYYSAAHSNICERLSFYSQVGNN